MIRKPSFNDDLTVLLAESLGITVRAVKARESRRVQRERDARRERDRAYRNTHGGVSYSSSRHCDLKLECFRHYSGQIILSCQQIRARTGKICGFNDMRALDLRPVTAAARLLRDELAGGSGGHPFYAKLKARHYPPGFQVACNTCANLLVHRGGAYGLKIEVVTHYNPEVKCSRCQENDVHALTIDHVHGGGREHLKSLGIEGGYQFYQWLKDNDYPPGYRVLCWNCQQIVREECKEYVHHDGVPVDASVFAERAESTRKLVTYGYPLPRQGTG